MLRRIITAYSAWSERSRARQVHFHAGPRGAVACDNRLCSQWTISADEAGRMGFE
jgi:hypothetical protein